MISKVCVFCASSHKVDQKYFDIAERTANVLVENNITTVYGGGAVGLMGKLADSVIEKNGEIIGIIPSFMMDVEWGHKNVSELIVVTDMHERKKRLIEGVDAIVILPGGSGTLEETMEVITLKRLGKFTKPIVFVNTDDFYNNLFTLFDKMIEEKFMREEHRDMWVSVKAPEDIISAISSSPVWDESAINIAAV
ncbi:MAG: Rossman fold protein, TIGR00730 family [Bacteroidetes bacterium GWC2_33_15]|nr:MAG: Rossman fold protein, TIGR00730 family [Bacteroidetes bacterium GWA2_33_15]OFX52565.1 MAG: Rossman fold protein, TIGR00730 family [Bacteroidetes bacterium GWC2_33_15]OFX63910.1 MAG: Rossman fold protein, TIGR00730 family [Bacteroidetes bacterium GWB2_32_14]OFX70823.1 MAG: Rossman fold protein, TIGR00730 family [Bacteroidetes bacterium GWD2_33_33]HAN19951.1 TIGR00730 family Rossman fold protein [Bacteroidales bacterium]